jgi:DNA-binding protein
MADKYRRVDKTIEVLPSNEIRVKRKVGIGRYLKRANDLFAEEGNNQVVIKGVSNAVESAVKLAELIKHRIAGLHQTNKISHITILDEYEPLEEGLDHLKFTRIVTMLEITLSKQPLDTKDIGYQPPIDESLVQPFSEKLDNQTLNGENRPPKRRNNNKQRNGRGGKPAVEGQANNESKIEG